MGVPEGEKKRKTQSIFEKIWARNFPNFVKHINVYNQEAQQTPVG